MFTLETGELGSSISLTASVQEEENCKWLLKAELVFLVGSSCKGLSLVGPAASLGRDDSRLNQEETGQEGLMPLPPVRVCDPC